MEWLIRVIEGPDKGTEQRVDPGGDPVVIGRGRAAGVRLSPEDVSWEHAVVTEERGELYVENLSALGTWVGDAKVAGRVRLRPRDRVRLSKETVLQVDSADGGTGLLGNRGFLVAVLLLLLALLGAVAYFQAAGGSTGTNDWGAAYNALLPWAKQQAARKRLAPEAAEILQDAWRLDNANAWAASHKLWLRLQVALAADEKAMRCFALAAKDPNDQTLQSFLTPPPGYSPSEEDKAAALGQFVRRRMSYSKAMADKSSSFLK